MKNLVFLLLFVALVSIVTAKECINDAYQRCEATSNCCAGLTCDITAT